MKTCPKCLNSHIKPGIFCSRQCANSRGSWSVEHKQLLREKLTGRKMNENSIRKMIASKNQTCHMDEPRATSCVICGADIGIKKRKTCSVDCYRSLCRKNSQRDGRCGGQKHTHRSRMQNIDGVVYVLESSFERRLANDLNRNNILWVRPNPVTYVDQTGATRRYYPDFYLPAYNVYLDPKNDFLIETDIDKIKRSAKQNKIRIFVLRENHLTWNSIKSVVVDGGTAPPSSACKTDVLLLN